MRVALIGAVVLGVLSAFYDFVWAHFDVRHKVLNGLVHGMTLLSVLGLVLGWPSGRRAAWSPPHRAADNRAPGQPEAARRLHGHRAGMGGAF